MHSADVQRPPIPEEERKQPRSRAELPQQASAPASARPGMPANAAPRRPETRPVPRTEAASPVRQDGAPGPHPRPLVPQERRRGPAGPGSPRTAGPTRTPQTLPRRPSSKTSGPKPKPFLRRLGHPGFPRLKKFILSLTAAVLLFAVLSVGASLYLKQTGKLSILTVDQASRETSDAILVFGCGVYADGSPTPMLADRVRRGVELYAKGAAPKLLLSGDHGQKHYDEVGAMKKLALELGVAEEDIFLDHAGFSTWDSLRRARDVFGAQRLVLVSQRYHLYRCLFLARALGLDSVASAADTRPYGGQWLRDLREILAVDKALVTALRKPLPEISGSPIDLKGDGRVSWD